MQIGNIQAGKGTFYFRIEGDPKEYNLGNVSFEEMYKIIAGLGFRMTTNEFVKE